MMENSSLSLNEYRMLESNLHRELVNCCKKYFNNLGIVSVVELIDIVKLEVVEFQKLTKDNVDKEKQEFS